MTRFPFCCGLLAALLWTGCAPEDSAGERIVDAPEDEVEVAEPAHPLVGTWKTHGTDPILGEVDVLMYLETDGGLRMVLMLAGGGRRSFPGTWEAQEDELVLQGAYFEPAGEQRVRWAIREDGVLVLEEEGRQQEWERQGE